MTYTKTITNNITDEDKGSATVTILNDFYREYGQWDNYSVEIINDDVIVTVIYNDKNN